MYENPLYRENEEKLRRHGYHFAEPVSGYLACGWEGKGKMQDPSLILETGVAVLSRKDLAGMTIMVTAGPTREEVDPVRYVSNHSSGKMGYALARAAWRRGARVLLVSGPTALTPPFGAEFIPVESARQMRDAVLARAPECDVIVKAAAVADYRPRERAGDKLKKRDEEMIIELVKNPDILRELGGAKRPGQLLVGFAAETADLETNAMAKLTGKNLDLIVANDVSAPGAGFGVDTNIVRLLYRDGTREELPLLAKDEVAAVILDRIVTLRETVRAKESD
jgi:phosphopantothenoylcysteine decarboxylase/phosphopantothenate--cysteine ligase